MSMEQIYKDYVSGHRARRFKAIRQMPKEEQAQAVKDYRENLRFCRQMEKVTYLSNDLM